MCTAATYKTKDFYFGRNLDYEVCYGESVTVMPRSFPLKMRRTEGLGEHYAVIGMAHVAEGYPLYYDGTNEKGLSAAGLNFVGNAVYNKPRENKINVAQFELIPYILGKCADVSEARRLIEKINIIDDEFAPGMTTAQLHWIIADKSGCIVIESVKEGLMVYDNPVGVLTNNPPFPYQMFALNNYMALSPDTPENTFAKEVELNTYSRGMGAIGLPGDLSSQSRFIRAAFVANNSLSGEGEEESLSQFFHILKSVEQQRGCCKLSDGSFEITLYSSCCNADKGIYYYTTYSNGAVTAVNMHNEKLDSDTLSSYPLRTKMRIDREN